MWLEKRCPAYCDKMLGFVPHPSINVGLTIEPLAQPTATSYNVGWDVATAESQQSEYGDDN